MNFWEEMKNRGRPILCLAPMADVTDAAFRYIISKYSKKLPKGVFEMHRSQKTPFGNFVTYTEFVSADGLVKAPEAGRKKLLKDLEYSEIERPIVAQFFTSKPENMYKTAMLAMELGPAPYHPSGARIGSGFDGVDINMGCPDKSIEKQLAGAALMKNPKLAREIIIAAKKGVAEAAKKLNKEEIPISIKTRLGYNKDELETWLPELLAESPAAIIVHARTRKEMSKAPAKWERIKRAVEIRNEVQTSPLTPLLDLGEGKHRSNIDNPDFSLFPSHEQGEGHAKRGVGFRTLIIGNGDVADTDDARRKCKETGADGAMIGRGIFGNPWLFAGYTPNIQERLKVLIEHARLFEEKFKGVKNFAIMKKHFKEYLSAVALAKEDLNLCNDLRDLKFKFMRAENVGEVERLANDFLFLYNKTV